jgi:hypothetical protein
MEILIGEDLADKYQIDVNDFFVNEKKSVGVCRIKPVNETHFRFWLPYDKCATSANVRTCGYLRTCGLFLFIRSKK